MKARELAKDLCDWADSSGDYSKTCDTFKCGDPDRELRKVAVSMFATPNLIREAHKWGADMLIVHEPTFYSHFDERLANDPVTKAKEKLLAEAGFPLFRFHDHPHAKQKDMICEGELKYLGLKGRFIKGPRFAVNRFVLDEPMTPKQLASQSESKLDVKNICICGAADAPMTRLSLCFGTPGGVFEELRSDEIDVVLTGEACEWMLGEYARDAAQLGFKKALLVMGHIGSERAGMRLLADLLQEERKDFETRYFECGEAYSYTA